MRPRMKPRNSHADHARLVSRMTFSRNAAVLLGDPQPHVPAARRHRVVADVGGVAPGRHHGRPGRTVRRHLQVEVAAVPGAVLAAGAGVAQGERLDAVAGAEIDAEELGAAERAPLVGAPPDALPSTAFSGPSITPTQNTDQAARLYELEVPCAASLTTAGELRGLAEPLPNQGAAG